MSASQEVAAERLLAAMRTVRQQARRVVERPSDVEAAAAYLLAARAEAAALDSLLAPPDITPHSANQSQHA